MINKLKDRTIQIFKNHSLPRWLVLVIDITTVFLTFLFSYMLRYNLEPLSFSLLLAIKQGLMVCVIYLVFMLLFKSYSGLLRQTTIKDTFIIAVTNTAAFAVLFIITLGSRKFIWNPFFNVPLSILMIHYGTVTVSLIFFRVFIKMFYVFVSVPSSSRKNVLIYGSGETGIIVKRVIESDPRSGYQLKGFIDDNIKLQGKKVDGFPVFSERVLTKEFVEAEGIKVFIFAIKDISVTRKKDVLESLIDLGLEILDTPSFDKWLNGNLQVKQLRKVQLEDLLGREPITLDLMRIEKGLKGKTILVTGAAGSIGSEIVRQLTYYNYKQLVLIDQAETPSFYLNNELMDKFPDCRYKLIVGDVTNELKMDFIFKKYHPEIVFHAAAYKHVPVMEKNPHEAFRVNVGGTKIISELAIKYKAEKFVMISSDKAVNPTNVMGATKKVCELLVQAQARRSETNTKFVTTRFGNVLGSNGSVIPLFKKQIAEGGPVTITDPEITRFFMTIPEACQLVLEAGFMGNGGEIFIFDMGKSIKILDIATKLIHLSGLVPYKDIEIKFIGLRPGEKLFEELFSDNEQQLPTHNPKISIARVADEDFDSILPKINDALITIYKKSGPEVVEAIKEIVPGYTSKYAKSI
ncbi:MAG: nucleoside-diphosphate sugar epimerase/dehydratase [Bacteroidia bacterium]|nr:nucleoside-diphosphate sugar epimerase/dehydratase [Bacteroidia bacterium]